jgi:hypothetical protein
MTDVYVEDELPLPSFAEVFGESLTGNKKKRKSSTSGKLDGLLGDESTG